MSMSQRMFDYMNARNLVRGNRRKAKEAVRDLRSVDEASFVALVDALCLGRVGGHETVRDMCRDASAVAAIGASACATELVVCSSGAPEALAEDSAAMDAALASRCLSDAAREGAFAAAIAASPMAAAKHVASLAGVPTVGVGGPGDLAEDAEAAAAVASSDESLAQALDYDAVASAVLASRTFMGAVASCVDALRLLCGRTDRPVAITEGLQLCVPLLAETLEGAPEEAFKHSTVSRSNNGFSVVPGTIAVLTEIYQSAGDPAPSVTVRSNGVVVAEVPYRYGGTPATAALYGSLSWSGSPYTYWSGELYKAL